MIIFFILLGLIPSFAWLFFFLKEDAHPEPKKMIAFVFIAGIFSTFFALGLQFVLRGVLNSAQIGNYTFLAFLGFGAIEETLKFFAAYLVIRKRTCFDEPIDAMIYMITAALGFAMLENIAVLSNIKVLSEAFSVVTLRFVGATLLHALSSAIVGYYWARGIILSRRLKPEKEPPCHLDGAPPKIMVLKGLILATLLHAAFNYFILISEEVLIYPTIFLIIAALFVFWDFEKIKNG